MKYKNILIFISGFICCALFVFLFKKLDTNNNKTIDNSLYSSNLEEDDKYIKNVENYDKYKIVINGREKQIGALKIGKDIYLNIVELKNSLNNLKVIKSEKEKVLSIYEMTGLGITNYRGEEYIEYSKMMSRYAKIGELPYFSKIERRYVFKYPESSPILAFTKLPMEKPELYYYGDIYVKRTEFIEKLPLILDILHTNELYILDHPEVMINEES